MRQYQLFIGGEFIPNGGRKMIDVINPSTEEVISQIPAATVETAPEIFHVEDVAVVIGAGSDELLMAAAAGCPTSAIRIVDRESRQQVYP